MTYILKNSYIEQPAFAFSAALSLIATLSGRKFEFEGVAPNLYLLNVAPSGSGKNAPQEKSRKFSLMQNVTIYWGVEIMSVMHLLWMDYLSPCTVRYH